MDDQDKSGAYQRGFTAGYQRRMQEELASYFQAITAGHQIYDRVLKGLVNTPTASERELRRTWVVWQGHVAGLHDGGRRGCPYCDRLMREHPWARSETCPDCAHLATVHTLSGCRQAEYGVPEDGIECWCAVRSDMLPGSGAPLCEAHGQPMIPGLRAIVDGKIEQAWHCACSVTYRPAVSPCRCGHPLGDHGVNGCTWFEVSVPRQASDGTCPCRQTDDMLLNRGPVPAHNGDYVVPKTDLCAHGFIADGQACGEFGCTTPAGGTGGPL